MGEERLIGLLESVARWKLSESEWRRADEALAQLELALDGRPELLHRAEGALMMAGPLRVEKGLADVMDARRPKPMPAPTRELANRLLRRLGPSPVNSETGDGTSISASGAPRDDGAA